jgi:hypothetical protein
VSDNRPHGDHDRANSASGTFLCCSIAGLDTFEASFLGPVADNVEL